MTSTSYHQLLKVSNSSALYGFLHECVDDLLQKRCITFENYNKGDMECTEDDFNKTRTFVQNLFRQSVLENNLVLPNDLPTNIQEAISKCYKIRRDEIFQLLAKEYILQKGHKLVNNIDWRLKWILGSSDLVTFQEPTLQVDFYCSQKSGNETIKNIVNFEANLEQTDKLIGDLSALQKELQ